MTATANLDVLNEKIIQSLQNLTMVDPSTLTSGLPEQDYQVKAILQAITASETPEVQTRITSEYFGYGPLETLMNDPEITELIINGPQSIWLEKSGRLSRHADGFLSELTFRNFTGRVCREAGIQVSLDCPFADGSWRNFRVHLITPPASQVTVLTLRRHPECPWTLEELMKRNWASLEAYEVLNSLVEQKKNFLIIGPTGSGKTSVLNACLKKIPANERVVSIEDTSELALANPISSKLITRRDLNHLLREIDQSELVRQSLRMRPDRIIMGEIRGSEAKDLLMAFATGHSGCMGTLHAESARQALIRLEMLIQLGASQWSLHAVRTLILLSLDSIVVVKKNAQGERKLEGIYRLSSLEEMGFLLEKIC